mgnify:FL=1|tara:strand:+ start:447 stop:686 length:240 start_codon:yes stop_codon:yes gene_type:complete
MANYNIVVTDTFETWVSVPDNIKEDDLFDFLKKANIGDLIDFSCPKYTKEEYIPISKNSEVDFVISEDGEVETALGQGV